MNRLVGPELFPFEIVHQDKVNWRPVGQQNGGRAPIFRRLGREVRCGKRDKCPERIQHEAGSEKISPCSHGHPSLNGKIKPLSINAVRKIG